MATVQAQFGSLLAHVVGPALDAAGFALDNDPVQQAGGLFRYRRQRPDGSTLVVDYQVLAYTEGPSRFQVALRREGGLAEAPIALPRLVWDVFGVRVLPSADHWWAFADERTLADGLLESGTFLFGYGLPWLDGSLLPPRG